MNPTTKHLDAEERLRALLEGSGLPGPDEVAYFRAAVVFYFHITRALVLIDLDEFGGLDGLDPATLTVSLPGFAEAG